MLVRASPQAQDTMFCYALAAAVLYKPLADVDAAGAAFLLPFNRSHVAASCTNRTQSVGWCARYSGGAQIYSLPLLSKLQSLARPYALFCAQRNSREPMQIHAR